MIVKIPLWRRLMPWPIRCRQCRQRLYRYANRAFACEHHFHDDGWEAEDYACPDRVGCQRRERIQKERVFARETEAITMELRIRRENEPHSQEGQLWQR